MSFVDEKQLLRIACDSAGRDITTEQWRQYMGTAPPAVPACTW
ncbi:hypothetical protein ACQPZZ_18075 [Microbispora sp. CA-135349]